MPRSNAWRRRAAELTNFPNTRPVTNGRIPDGNYIADPIDRGIEDDERPKLSTNQKRLKLNLDPRDSMVTFVRDRAGQEFASGWFFRSAAAAGPFPKYFRL